jgi:lipopolysaccharide transport system ATP-binding protein
VIGPNGAGKSTLLKILSRITEPTEGEALIRGRVGSLLEVGTGFHPELTGRDNIYLNGSILGMTREEIDRKFDDIVGFSGVEKFIDTPVKHYSSGMYVRLAFSVAAYMETEILLVDEVLAVGDIDFQKKCLGKMENIAGEGRTVLFVSHNMAIIQALCPRSILLDEGQIKHDGSTSMAIKEFLSSSTETSDGDLSNRERPSRYSLRAKIVKINILADGVTNPARIDSTKPFTIRLFVKSDIEAGVKCTAQIRIKDELQHLVFLDSASLHNKYYHVGTGISQIDCEISPPNLYAGNYKIDCALGIPYQEIFDYVENAYSFEVSIFDPYKSGYDLRRDSGFGLFNIDHRWKDIQ